METNKRVNFALHFSEYPEDYSGHLNIVDESFWKYGQIMLEKNPHAVHANNMLSLHEVGDMPKVDKC